MNFNINIDMEHEADIDMNLDQKKCEFCGGRLKMERFNLSHVYYRCMNCGEENLYTFKSTEEAQYYADDAKFELFSRLRTGFIDWQLTDWNQLYKDFVEFINQQPHLESDLQFQMGLIACLTKGFHLMESEKYSQCKSLFRTVDRMYKQRLRVLRAQAKNPSMSESMEDYKLSREKYVHLRNQYLQTKMMYKYFWKILKMFFK